VSEEEAIALALWNNAAYQELLAQLGISQAQLLDAGLCRDPQLVTLFPLGPKQLEFTLFQFVDDIWLRPVRVRAAEMGLSRVAEQMIQNGLDVIRDVRLAHAELLFAQLRTELANEAEKIRQEIAELAQKRLDAGDISELEANDSRVQSLSAQAEAARLAIDVSLAQQRLLVQMGLALDNQHMVAVASPEPTVPERDESDLVGEALAMRPDLRAAEISLAELQQRADLARRQFLSFEAGIDANSKGVDGFEASPAIRMTLPIFNRNRGNIAIAKARLQQATRRYVTVRDQIALDVRTSYASARQADANLAAVRHEILPTIQQAVGLARKNYLDGGTSYFLVLQTTSQFLDTRAREIRLSADLRRAIAELERSVGHRFVTNAGLDRQATPETSEQPILDAGMAETPRVINEEALAGCPPVGAVPPHEMAFSPEAMLLSDQRALRCHDETPTHDQRRDNTEFDPRLMLERMR
jgi:cobalt-zinc-cadmium efflux system outer membrane protein